jgi:hypothetical protein
MCYKNGTIYNSQQAIRNEHKDTSLPVFMTDELIESLGYKIVLQVPNPATAVQVGTEDGVEVLQDGTVQTKWTIRDKTTEELQAEQSVYVAGMVKHFTDVTDGYIMAKVTAYNVANGLSFKDIDAFTKYAINPLSTHHTIANKFVTWVDAVWESVRAYHGTVTGVPTDAEFKAVLDGVVF